MTTSNYEIVALLGMHFIFLILVNSMFLCVFVCPVSQNTSSLMKNLQFDFDRI